MKKPIEDKHKISHQTNTFTFSQLKDQASRKQQSRRGTPCDFLELWTQRRIPRREEGWARQARVKWWERGRQAFRTGSTPGWNQSAEGRATRLTRLTVNTTGGFRTWVCVNKPTGVHRLILGMLCLPVKISRYLEDTLSDKWNGSITLPGMWKYSFRSFFTGNLPLLK